MLGVDWLKKNSPVTFNFKKCSITIERNEKKVVLQGNDQEGACKTISSKKLEVDQERPS